MSRALPRVLDALAAAGGHAFNVLGGMADVVPDSERFDCLTARRPLVESVLAAVASDSPGVTVRRGVGIQGLGLSAKAQPGVPHVCGVRTDAGEFIRADLVVAATGRRSPLCQWLVDAGARPAHDEAEDSGFIYYGRHLRSRDGAQLVAPPGGRDYGSVMLLALPGDNGTCGVGIIGSANDAALRPLRQEAVWERVMRRLPGGAELLEVEAISPLVAMAGLEDRLHRFVVDGAPVATGVVAVGDA